VTSNVLANIHANHTAKIRRSNVSHKAAQHCDYCEHW